MSQEVMELVGRAKPALIATATKDGVPNIAPKGSLMVVDEETLVYADLFPGKTTRNVQENPRVSIAVLDPEKRGGYQIKGRGERSTSGAMYRQACSIFSGLKIDLPPPEAVVVIKVEEVYDLAPRRSPKRE